MIVGSGASGGVIARELARAGLSVVLLEQGPRFALVQFTHDSQSYGGRPACIHCGVCHGFAREVRAKASTLTTVIPEAEATGRCEVWPNSEGVRPLPPM